MKQKPNSDNKTHPTLQETYMWLVVSNFLVVHDARPHWLLTVHQPLVHHGSRVAHENIRCYCLIEVVRCWRSNGNKSTVAPAAATRLWHNCDRGCGGRFRCGPVWVFQHFGEGRLECGRHLPPLHPVQDFLADVHLLLGRHFLVVLMQI